MIVCTSPLIFPLAGRPCHFYRKEKIAVGVLTLKVNEVFDAMSVCWCLLKVLLKRRGWTFVRNILTASDRQTQCSFFLVCVCGNSSAVLAPLLIPTPSSASKAAHHDS